MASWADADAAHDAPELGPLDLRALSSRLPALPPLAVVFDSEPANRALARRLVARGFPAAWFTHDAKNAVERGERLRGTRARTPRHAAEVAAYLPARVARRRRRRRRGVAAPRLRARVARGVPDARRAQPLRSRRRGRPQGHQPVPQEARRERVCHERWPGIRRGGRLSERRRRLRRSGTRRRRRRRRRRADFARVVRKAVRHRRGRRVQPPTGDSRRLRRRGGGERAGAPARGRALFQRQVRRPRSAGGGGARAHGPGLGPRRRAVPPPLRAGGRARGGSGDGRRRACGRGGSAHAVRRHRVAVRAARRRARAGGAGARGARRER